MLDATAKRGGNKARNEEKKKLLKLERRLDRVESKLADLNDGDSQVDTVVKGDDQPAFFMDQAGVKEEDEEMLEIEDGMVLIPTSMQDESGYVVN